MKPLLRFLHAGVVTMLLACLCPSVYAQDDFKPKAGTIDRASLEMTASPLDSSAEAVVLYDYGKLHFDYDHVRGFHMVLDCRMRVKILKESALDRASMVIPYYDGRSVAKSQSISEIRGWTYNLNDGVIVTTAMERSAVKKEKISDEYGAVKFNLPNVRKGSVIEYSYSKITPFSYTDRPDSWTFQSSVPVQWSEYDVSIPDYLDYKINMRGYVTPYISINERTHIDVGVPQLNSQGTHYRIVVKDAPSFTNEPFITTADDYVSKITFELAGVAIPGQMIKRYSQTWEQVDETFMNASWFGAELKRNVFGKDVLQSLLKDARDSTEKMVRGFDFIKTTMKWDDAKSMGSQGGIRKAYENKKGSSGDINLLLVNLLRELGLDCDPVVLSTRSNGMLIEYIPSFEGFNHVIALVRIGKSEYLLDATQAHAYPGLLPEYALNGRGRVLPRKNKGYFVDLDPKQAKSRLEMISAEIIPEEGMIKGEYSISMSGYEAYDWRNSYATDTDEIYADKLRKQHPEWNLKELTIKNKAEKLASPIEVKCQFEAENDGASPQLFYFNPMMASRMEANPLKSPTRIYPMDLATGIAQTFVGTFRLPDGYKLVETPKAEIISLPEKAGRFTYQVRQDGNTIQVSTNMMINKRTFTAEEYADVREFFEHVVQRHAQQLAIKKM